MNIPPGSYIKIAYDIKVKEFDGEKTIDGTWEQKTKVSEEQSEQKSQELVWVEKIFKFGGNELPKLVEKVLQDRDIELNKEYVIELEPKEAFGVRDPKLIEKMPIRSFRHKVDQGLFSLNDGSTRPAAGKIVYLNVGGVSLYYGRIIRVDSRAVIIDRNNPYAGKKVTIRFRISKVVPPDAPKNELLDIILEKFFGDIKEYIEREINEESLVLRVKDEYFKRFHAITRSVAEEILREIYVPKVILLTNASDLYSDLGVKRIIWQDEFEIGIPPKGPIEERGKGSEESESESSDSEQTQGVQKEQ